jgi:predicted dehydrogenase
LCEISGLTHFKLLNMNQKFDFHHDQVHWGVIGAGDVCEVKSAPAMDKIPSSKLVAIMRRNTEKAKDYAMRHQVPKWYDSADELINDPDVNAIYIATPPDTHHYFTLRAAEAGKPVYVEKPMARTWEECRDMIRACKKVGVPLYVAYYRRTLPNFLKIKSLIEAGEIGDVRTVHIQMCKAPVKEIDSGNHDNWRVIPEIAGGGLFYDLASHQLDFLDYLFGRIIRAGGTSTNQGGYYSAEDLVTGYFEFENGIMGTGNWCFTSSETSETDETTIIGSKGQITYETFGEPVIRLETDDRGEESFKFEMPENIQYYLIESIVNELLGNGHCPSTGDSAARTNWVLSQICDSI